MKGASVIRQKKMDDGGEEKGENASLRLGTRQKTN